MKLLSVDIPINQEPYYQVQVYCDKQRYNLRFHWNKRNEMWKMDLFDKDMTPRLYNLPCLIGNDGMIGRFVIEDIFPVGDIVILDSNGIDEDPNFENFGKNISPFYLSYADEIPQ